MNAHLKHFFSIFLLMPLFVFSQNCVDFESLVVGTQYGDGFNTIGDVIFTENDIPVTVEYFEWPGGGGMFGNCNIIDGTAIFGTGHAMWTNNINLGFDFGNIGFTPNRVTFDFSDMGGNENISVNGEPIFAGELNMAPMPTGITMIISNMGTYMRATLYGPVVSLVVGGQEFAIDNICAFIVEDPSECVDFELLPMGATYGDGYNSIGDVIFTENDIHVSVEYFEWTSGGTFGNCYVIDGIPTFGTGQAMWTSNINLKFDLNDVPYVTNWISFDYTDGGGHENFSINGLPIFVGELDEVLLPPGFSMGITDMGGYKHFEIATEQVITEFLVGGQEFSLDNICVDFILDPSNCIDFKYLALGAMFGDGVNPIGAEIFTENDIPVFVEYFEWIGGGTFGNCWVIDGDDTYGTGYAMWTSNINLRFDLSETYPASTQITFDFADYGGNENIGVNGHPLFVGELSAAVLPPGFYINITNMGSYEQATVVNDDGIITELVIGGQEFTIDNICPSYNVSIEDPVNMTGTSMLELGQNYPNPFTGHTVIPFELAEGSHVIITIYDHMGRMIEVLTDTEYKTGEYSVSWDPGNAANGIYFYQVRTPGYSQTMKMTLHK